MTKVQLIRNFPDYNQPGFSMEEYRNIYKDNNVIVHASSCDINFGEHWGTLTIKSAFKGFESYISSGCRYKVSDTSFLIINDGHLYSSYIDSLFPVESLALFYNRKYISEMYHYLKSCDKELLDNPFYYNNYSAKFDVAENRSTAIINYLYKLREVLTKDEPDEAAVDALMRRISEKILRLKASEISGVKDLPSLTLSGKKELYKRLERARGSIESNFSEEVTINNLSTIASLCPHHLIRKFKLYYGITPHQYLINVRLDNSKALLRETGHSISEVCSKVGFQSLGSFSSLFTKYNNISPLNYRKTHTRKSPF